MVQDGNLKIQNIDKTKTGHKNIHTQCLQALRITETLISHLETNFHGN